MSSESARLRRVLGRYRKNELPAVLQHLGVEPEEGAGGATKQQLLATALRKQAVGVAWTKLITSWCETVISTIHRLVASPREILHAWSFTVSVYVETGKCVCASLVYWKSLGRTPY